jgi:Alkylmercury lyase
MPTRVTCEQLRLAVYRAFAADGHAPRVRDLADRLGLDPAEVVAGLRQLASQRHLVLDDDSGDRDPDSVTIVMAHPFSAIPLGFAVMGPHTLWWGGCAWDSFALPYLLPDVHEVLVATRCPACHRPHAFNVTDHAPPPGEQVAHFLVPAAHMWDDVVRTCANQRIYCSRQCVDAWLTTTGSALGYVMDLTTLWRLASHWYDGRLEVGYTRRDPAASADYLRSVGLTGPFWGH